MPVESVISPHWRFGNPMGTSPRQVPPPGPSPKPYSFSSPAALFHRPTIRVQPLALAFVCGFSSIRCFPESADGAPPPALPSPSLRASKYNSPTVQLPQDTSPAPAEPTRLGRAHYLTPPLSLLPWSSTYTFLHFSDLVPYPPSSLTPAWRHHSYVPRLIPSHSASHPPARLISLTPLFGTGSQANLGHPHGRQESSVFSTR